MSLIPHRRRSTGRQRARVNLDHAMSNAHAVGGELLGKRRRRAAVLQPVLVPVPRAGYAAVGDAPLADRPILVGTKIRERPDLRAIAEDCDAFAIRRRHAASGRRLGERFAGPTQPRDHPQILAIRSILEMMVGHVVEFSKHQCLSRGIYDAHAAENWSGSTDSGVTTGIEVGRIRHVRLSLRDGWSKCRYGESEPDQ